MTTFGLCIGVNAAVFSLIYTVLLHPFPFPEPGRLVRIHSVLTATGEERENSGPDLFDWRERSRTFSALSSYFAWNTQITGDGGAESVFLTWVTPDFFRVLGMKPVLGRTFLPDEDRAGGDVHKVVLSHDLWRSRYGGDPGVIGRRITLRQTVYTVVGVMPAGFQFPSGAKLWAPHQSFYDAQRSDRRLKYRGRRVLPVLGRLQPGTTLEQAQAELDSLAAALERDHPDTNEGIRYRLRLLRETEIGPVRPYLLSLYGAVLFVLLIGCTNVTNLLLVRAATREQEMGMRVALGADRFSLIRQSLTESILLAVMGGAVGVALAFAAVRVLPRLLPVHLPFWMRFEIAPGVLVYSAVLSILAGLLCGIVPALRASRRSLTVLLKTGVREGQGRRSLLREGLVITEITLAVLLLIGAGLMMKSFLHLQRVDSGFRVRNVAVAFVSPYRPGESASERTEAYATYYRRVLEELRRLPGVLAVGGSDMLPYVQPEDGATPGAQRTETLLTTRSQSAAEAERTQPALSFLISPDFLDAMGIPLLDGRKLSASDTVNAPPVVLVSARAARTLWPGLRSAVGQELRMGNDQQHPWARVVGVVGDVKIGATEGDEGLEIYFPYTQQETGFFHFVVRTAGNADAIAGHLRRTIAAVDSQTAVVHVKTLNQIIAESLWQWRLWGGFFTYFAILALLLAAVGVYGVMSYMVSLRTGEIGIRAALGASAGDNVRLIVVSGVRMVAAGVVLGVAAATLLGRLLSSLLFGVTATDLTTFVGAAAVLAAVALLACYLPARRAASLEPIICLRHE